MLRAIAGLQLFSEIVYYLSLQRGATGCPVGLANPLALFLWLLVAL